MNMNVIAGTKLSIMLKEIVSAIDNGKTLEEIQNMVENGYNLNQILCSRTPLEAAVERKSLELVKYILSHKDYQRIDDRVGPFGSVLHLACRRDYDINIIRELLERHVLSNINEDLEGETPLHWACEYCDKDVVELLIWHGADINATTEHIVPPIYYALQRDDIQILQSLVRHGVEIFPSACYETSILQTAICRRHPGVKLLLRYATLHRGPRAHWNQLTDAIFSCDMEMATELVERGHEIDRLCLYTATISTDIDMFVLIWNNMPPDLISKDPYYLVHVFENWPENDEPGKLLEILRDPMSLSTYICGDAFSHYVYREGLYLVANVDKRTYTDLVQSLVTGGMRLSPQNIEFIVNMASHIQMVDLIQIIIEIALPKITQEAYTNALLTHMDHKFLIPYCLEPKLYFLDAEWNLPFVLHYCALFTFSDIEKHEIRTVMRQRVAEISEPVDAILDRMKAKSLTEVARDAVRKYLNHICIDCRHMLRMLQDLNVPQPIADIIRLKTPVNVWVYDLAAGSTRR